MTTPSPDDNETNQLILTGSWPDSEPWPRPLVHPYSGNRPEVAACFEGGPPWVYRYAKAGHPVIWISGGSLPWFPDMVSGVARGEETRLTPPIRERTCVDGERSNLVAGFKDEDGKLWRQRCRRGG
jgi:hypothetical protein